MTPAYNSLPRLSLFFLCLFFLSCWGIAKSDIYFCISCKYPYYVLNTLLHKGLYNILRNYSRITIFAFLDLCSVGNPRLPKLRPASRPDGACSELNLLRLSRRMSPSPRETVPAASDPTGHTMKQPEAARHLLGIRWVGPEPHCSYYCKDTWVSISG